MALPKAVKEQVDRANEILEQMHAPQTPEPDEKAKEKLELVKDEPPVEEAEVEEPATAVVEPVEEPPAEEPPKVEKPPAEDFEHKYKVLRGKYENEVPRLSRQVSDLNAQLDTMRQMLADLQAQPPAEDQSIADISAEEIEEYGTDLLDLIGRKATQVAKKEIDTLNAKVAELEGQLGGVSQATSEVARDKVLAKLDDEVEDWRAINRQDAFLDWLDEPDPYSGELRGKMLEAAYNRNDAGRVVAFFKGFLQEHAVVAPPKAAVSDPVVRTPSVDLNEQVAPGRTRRSTGEIGAQKEKRLWTRADIAHFYSELQKGRFKGDATERTAIESDIVAAAREGRIR